MIDSSKPVGLGYSMKSLVQRIEKLENEMSQIFPNYEYSKQDSRKDADRKWWYCPECKEFVKTRDSLGDICCCKCDLVIASYKKEIEN